MESLDLGPRLKENKSGYWTLVWAERGDDGKWRSREVTTRSKDRVQAEAFRRAWVAAEATPEPDAITVASLIDAYLEHASERAVGRGQGQILKPVRSLLGGYLPEQITLDIQRAYKAQRHGYQRDAVVSPGTLRRELGALVAVLRWAVRYRGLDAGRVPPIDLPTAPPPREVFLNEAEEARLWGLAAADRDRAGRLSPVGLFICLALGTGARSGAIKALTWDRVDLGRGTIDFRVPGEKVTKKRKVSTLINTRLAPVLARARSDWPFRTRVFEHTMRVGLEGFLGRHGFGHITPHAFRHTFVTLSLRGGMSVWDVSNLVGASPDVLYKVYGHHTSDDRLRAVANARFKA